MWEEGIVLFELLRVIVVCKKTLTKKIVTYLINQIINLLYSFFIYFKGHVWLLKHRTEIQNKLKIH